MNINVAVEKEACPLDLAPTASTTAALAMGDALAVALMEHRRFTPEHFRTFHPGGKLGARLARVGDLMHEDMPLVPETAPMAEARLTISRKGFGVTGVTDGDGRLVGIITDGDLRRHMDGLLTHPAAEAMTRIDRFVCDIKESQYGDGLHVFGTGQCGAEENAGLLQALRRAAEGAEVPQLAGELRALAGETLPTPPIWMMRQAGRFPC